MKTIFNYFISFCESIGKAKAASVLARMGKYDEAKKIMVSDHVKS